MRLKKRLVLESMKKQALPLKLNDSLFSKKVEFYLRDEKTAL